MKYLEDEHFAYWEYQYLKFIKMRLTTDWYILQSGVDEVALMKWLNIMRFLELDKKARLDLLLLAQSGIVGRTQANKLLWNLLSNWALDPTYEDLSHKVSSEVGWARRTFDRPPRGHKDLGWWRWSCYDAPKWHKKWSPLEVPRGHWDLVRGLGGEPLPPPLCWGVPHQ